jgi:hypothetical protein
LSAFAPAEGLDSGSIEGLGRLSDAHEILDERGVLRGTTLGEAVSSEKFASS